MVGRYQALGRFLVALLGIVLLFPVSGVLEKTCAAAAIAGLCVARMAIDRSRYDRLFAGAVGFLLPTVPWVGPNLLFLCGVWFFVLRSAEQSTTRPDGSSDPSLMWLAPFMCYVAGSVLGELAGALGVADFGSRSVLGGVSVDGAMRAVDLVRALIEVHVPSVVLSARVVLAGLLISFFAKEVGARACFTKWLIRGTAVSAVYVVVQWLGMVGIVVVSPFELPNQSALWNALGRPSGLMTDPNALGIVLALTLWAALLDEHRGSLFSPRGWCWVVLLMVAGTVSGSRTFLLAVAVLIPTAAWHAGRRRMVWGAVGAVVILCAVVTVLDRYSGTVEQLVALQGLPGGIRRGVQALSLIRLEDTLMSRSVFVEFASEIARGHWLFGVGADRFIDYVPLVGAKRDLVRGWRDNSNNLYLGILVELGVVGGVTFLLAIVGRALRSGGNRCAALGCVVMLAVIGCTGPHTDFTEVLFLVAFLVAITTEPRAKVQHVYTMMAIVAGVVGLYSSTYREQGVYGWSDTPRGASRWLSHRAVIELPCEHAGVESSHARLLLQPRYIPQSEPLRVTYGVVGQQCREISLRTSEIHEATFACGPSEERIFVRVDTRPAWSPYRAWPGVSNDRRILGLEQLSPLLLSETARGS